MLNCSFGSLDISWKHSNNFFEVSFLFSRRSSKRMPCIVCCLSWELFDFSLLFKHQPQSFITVYIDNSVHLKLSVILLSYYTIFFLCMQLIVQLPIFWDVYKYRDIRKTKLILSVLGLTTTSISSVADIFLIGLVLPQG